MGNWQTALATFCDICKDHSIDFYLIGSITASARGVAIDPRDIDAIVDINDLPVLEKAFAAYITAPIAPCPPDEVVGLFGKLEIDGVNVEISALPQNQFGRHTIEMFCWNGHILKAQSLELLYKVYKKDARTAPCRAIEEFWQSME